MPRGKYVNHKGRSRHFTSPEELQHQNDEESSEAETSSDDEEETEGATASSSSKAKSKPKVRAKKTAVADNKSDEDSDESDSEESEDDRDARKGVASLIEIENPNRAVKKSSQKLKNLSISEEPAKPELSRREREQIEKQKARIRYNKLHAAGKTTEAKADLARLALIRQQRADAAAKREAEKKASEDKKSTTSAKS